MQGSEPPQEGTSVRDQATAWVMRLTSGGATLEDAAALQRWRGESDAHRRAFAEAKLLWDVLGPATTAIVPKADGGMPTLGKTGRGIGRRALIGGALAASAGAFGYFGSRPPFLLWPSVTEMLADYRTGTGEQRRLAVTANVSLILNTQTSINVQKLSSVANGFELVSGEAAVTTNTSPAAPFHVLAADGRTIASMARFDVRRDGAHVRVMNFDGVLNVVKHGQSVVLKPGYQVSYDTSGLGEVLPVDLSIATAWQNGMLIFRHETLARVIAEVNRYRPGRIILIDDKLAARDVVASFHLARIDEVVDHIAQVFDAHVTYLPGGVVLLG
jgi:transmembrane sensor